MSAKGWTDQRIEVIIGVLLRTGVLLAASVVLIGGVTTWYATVARGRITPAFHGEPEGLKSIPGIAEGMAGLHGQAIIQFGLLLLIATPVARVAFSAVGFAMERDYMYVVITLIVLAILLYSLFGSSG